MLPYELAMLSSNDIQSNNHAPTQTLPHSRHHCTTDSIESISLYFSSLFLLFSYFFLPFIFY